MMQNMYSVCSLGWFPIMHHVGDEVICCVFLCHLSFFCQVLTKVYIPVEKNTKGQHEQVQSHNGDNILLKLLSTHILDPADIYPQHLRDGEVDDCGVLLHEEVVLGESFDAKDEVRRQFGQLEPFEEILFVGFVLLNVDETGEHAQTFRVLCK